MELKGCLSWIAVVVLAWGCVTGASLASASDQSGAWLTPNEIEVTPGGVVYLLCPGVNEVRVFDADSMEQRKVFTVGAYATGMACSRDGILYVTSSDNGRRKGEIQVLRSKNGETLAHWPAGYGCSSPVLSRDGMALFVCNRYAGTVACYSTVSGDKRFEVATGREPFAVAVSLNGNRLVVTHALPEMAANSEHVACAVAILDAVTGEVLKKILLPNGAIGLRNIAISPDGKYAIAVHVLARFYLPVTQIERGWINSNALSIFDLEALEWVSTVLLDSVDSGTANPWDVVWSQDGQTIVVTHAGTHELTTIQTEPLFEKLCKAEQTSQSADSIANDLSFLEGIRTRIKLAGNGPRAVTLDENRAYVAHYFSDTVDVVNLSKTRNRVRSFSLQGSKALSKEEDENLIHRGEQLFNDAVLCFQGWQTCASCHSHDARVDGINWDLTNDGVGTPKNTKSLLFAHQTPPAMSTGIRRDAETAVRAGIRHSLFMERPEADAVAIDAYLKAMRPMPSPYLTPEGELTAQARVGKRLFESPEVGCSTCHSGKLYTDKKLHDVGTAGRYDKPGQLFDTPTLVELWRTAPWLHDGSATSMTDVLVARNSAQRHGRTSQLSESELDALAAYLLSL